MLTASSRRFHLTLRTFREYFNLLAKKLLYKAFGADNEIKSAVPGLVGESVIVLIRDNAIAFERCRLLLESDILGMPSV